MSEAYSILAEKAGGPEVLVKKPLDLTSLKPQAGQVLLRHQAIGVNFIDIYHRSGLYGQHFPSPLGCEAAGVIEATGPDVKGFKVGDRVAIFTSKSGAYATHRIVDAHGLVALPDDISAETAAAVLLKGMTSWMLAEKCLAHALIQGEAPRVLVLAAAGGVGSLLVPWLKHLGVTVFAHTSTAEKAEKVKANGADYITTLPYSELPDWIKKQNQGEAVHAVLDSVGAASWKSSLASLGKRGLWVSYGNASGPVPPLSPLALAAAGSLYMSRPRLKDYVDNSVDLMTASQKLFYLLRKNILKAEINQRFPLTEAAKAHALIESRKTTGSTILIP
ncbi:MAG: quinone oxidoreductase [Zymomonas mobilis subsp. pomaceae]|uniref:Alcohol dehydrogenase GroES domain protein n=1 Tax=Zymomonas mobilis subsp. pomaceae (strain ATCC 29192 / DSM 22645 / JCM 10191 / CCUG 17912 / NBRC 13757 / NCIMB 11200 / NRRL B-4491 / Barker I) TaxID=579138 RepID=F8ETW5_ZYMMT|nr:quinone oxidoreductase [Zymomonas mobilis]AEI38062.1 Alcohol dehydrogenase GroES domain protein [Zymomonas mobilis subsp. pomaceae ATCC 29192]MDX5949429.1 quinone oxidoreductase [Zymomonas mobilis subsp. pomaceae]GEB89172.1 quinone oxidoreductase [Zymomonas mobilis subsp. pomaceae]